ncbi:putative protease sohB [Salmonella enterica subsp. enterica serovar Enteritidis]|nr:putative protease sohB [Salmonella enterica subsp. enterica serovar Enteritidis]
MMACVAEKIIAAPFAIVGSIGVVAQIPNFNRFLKSKDIDIELHTAGQYKRTLTLLGENTEEGRQKFREDLNETHHLFKEFVQRMRPALDIEQVATGEHWYGQQALEKGLVDEINTSDEVILGLMEGREVLNVRYMQRKKTDRSCYRQRGGKRGSAAAALVAAWTKAVDVNRYCRMAFSAIRHGLINQVILLRQHMRQVFKHVKHRGAFRGR